MTGLIASPYCLMSRSPRRDSLARAFRANLTRVCILGFAGATWAGILC